MEVLCKVIEQSAERKAQTAQGEVSVVDLTLASGGNRFIASAFGMEAVRIITAPLDKAAWYMCDLTFTISGTDRKFQSVRLNRANRM